MMATNDNIQSTIDTVRINADKLRRKRLKLIKTLYDIDSQLELMDTIISGLEDTLAERTDKPSKEDIESLINDDFSSDRKCRLTEDIPTTKSGGVVLDENGGIT